MSSGKLCSASGAHVNCYNGSVVSTGIWFFARCEPAHLRAHTFQARAAQITRQPERD